MKPFEPAPKTSVWITPRQAAEYLVGVNVNLARWSGQFVDPRRRQHDTVVMNRLRPSIDDHLFRPEGDYEVLGGKQTLRQFFVEWREHYAKVYNLRMELARGHAARHRQGLRSYTLEHLEDASLQIERWLNEQHRVRNARHIT